MPPINLFNPDSLDVYSVVFEVKTQLTVMATGMQPGDYISFEIIKISGDQRAKICGCRLTPAILATIEALQELQCPACEELTQRPVRVTPQNPTAVLDVPQGTLLRAVYHGTGLDLRSVYAWGVESSTPDLTDTLRGCPPIYYPDDEQVWTDTGQFRCLADQITIEYEQVNECGRRRWFPDPERPQIWVDTGQFRCLEDQVTIEIEQSNQCNDRRWIVSETEQIWTDTGQIRCLEDQVTIENEQVNQCGDRRWVESEVEQIWTDTQAVRCLDNGTDIEIEQTNQCGDRRWSLREGEQTWRANGVHRCTSGGDVELQEVNQCGDTRWVVCGDVVWTDTGQLRCVEGDETSVVEAEQTNQCGHRRWVEIGPQEWTDTANIRCLDDEETVEVEQTNQCGHRRWVTAPYDQRWIANGTVRCFNDEYQHLEVNRCGLLRWLTIGPVTWTDTGATYCAGAARYRQQVNQCGELRWVYDGVNEWTATGETACLEGTLREQQIDSCGTLRWVDTEVECGDSVHTVSVTVEPLSGLGGDEFCWEVTLDSPVYGSDLTLESVLSGAEQDANSYVAPSLVIPIGETTGQLCVTTDPDAGGAPDRLLCLQLVASPRVPTVPAPVCALVQNPGVEPMLYNATLSALPATGDEGDTFTFTVDLDNPVVDTDLLVQVALSGTEQVAHGYASPRTVTIAVGLDTGFFTVDTINDGVGGPDTTLTGTIQSNARLATTGAPASVTVQATEIPPIDCTCQTGWFNGVGYLPSYGVYATQPEAEAAAAVLGVGYSAQSNGVNCWHVVRSGDVVVDECPPF